MGNKPSDLSLPESPRFADVGEPGDPIPVITSSATVGEAPFTVTFDAGSGTDSDGHVVSYDWDFGDGTTASGVNASHTYEEHGNFVVKLTVTDNLGNTGQVSWAISVKTTGPFTDPTQVVPGKIEMEFYDHGGEGFAYHDGSHQNQGGAFRVDESVDIVANTDEGVDGFHVGYTDDNEWLEFTVNVAKAGSYQLHIRSASHSNTGSRVSLGIDEQVLSDEIVLPGNTGGWKTFTTTDAGVINFLPVKSPCASTF